MMPSIHKNIAFPNLKHVNSSADNMTQLDYSKSVQHGQLHPQPNLHNVKVVATKGKINSAGKGAVSSSGLSASVLGGAVGANGTGGGSNVKNFIQIM